MVLEQQDKHESQWAAITSIAEKFGCTAETLRSWGRRAERDAGRRREQIDRAWREHREVYGVRKAWKQLHQEGHPVARCTVARLMRQRGLRTARPD
jgi:transposase-like protein